MSITTTDHDGWHYDPPQHCGGISINGGPQQMCEVHMMPWGHLPPGGVQ